MPALRAADELGVEIAGVVQVIAPVVNEQAPATSARSRGERSLAESVLCHDSAPLQFFE